MSDVETRKCPKCGEDLSEEVAFCESCGAKVDAPDRNEGQAMATIPEPTEDSPNEDSEKNQSPRSRRLLIGTAIALVLLAGGFAGGYLVADDSSQVSELESELDATAGDLDDADAEVASLSRELEDISDDRDELATKLKAERSISGEIPEPDPDIDVSADADYVLGDAGIVGPTVMRPTSLEEIGTGGGGIKYALEVEVKNDSKAPINPFCGGDEATIVDTTGREYSGEVTFNLDAPNCGDDIQPGLTKGGYLMEFTLSKDADPALIELVYETFSDEEPVSWAVK